MTREMLTYGGSVLIIVMTIALGYLFNKIFSKIINNSTLEMHNDPTNYRFLKHLIIALIYVVGFSLAIYIVPSLKALAGSLLAGAGILAVSVGFASQHALSNIISGVFIVIFKPFKINDRLTVRTFSGTVEDITLRHTVIRDFENKRVVIPNAVISDEVIVNSDFAEEKIIKWIDIGISYDSDIDLAKSIIEQEVLNHPSHLDARTPEQIEAGEPEVPVRVLALADSAVMIRAWAWAQDQSSAFRMACDLYESIKKRFDREGVEIPFPHRIVVMKEKK
jgi:small conductance mechanosensitive channel